VAREKYSRIVENSSVYPVHNYTGEAYINVLKVIHILAQLIPPQVCAQLFGIFRSNEDKQKIR
jgi:hypothetical protein